MFINPMNMAKIWIPNFGIQHKKNEKIIEEWELLCPYNRIRYLSVYKCGYGDSLVLIKCPTAQSPGPSASVIGVTVDTVTFEPFQFGNAGSVINCRSHFSCCLSRSIK